MAVEWGKEGAGKSKEGRGLIISSSHSFLRVFFPAITPQYVNHVLFIRLDGVEALNTPAPPVALEQGVNELVRVPFAFSYASNETCHCIGSVFLIDDRNRNWCQTVKGDNAVVSLGFVFKGQGHAVPVYIKELREGPGKTPVFRDIDVFFFIGVNQGLLSAVDLEDAASESGNSPGQQPVAG